GDVLVRTAASRGFYARGNLISIGFIRRSLEHPAEAVSKSEAWFDAPAILAKEFVVIDGVTPLDRCALGKGVTIAGKIVDPVAFGKDAHNDSDRAVVVWTEILINCGKAVVGRVQGAGGAGDSTRVEIDSIGLNVGKRIGEASVVIANQKQVCAEL